MSVVLIDGLRSPFGSFGGYLKDTDPVTLSTKIIKALFEKTGISPEEADEIIMGNVIQDGPESIYLARHAGLKSGMRVDTPSLNVNRLCGSGLEAVFQAYYSIMMKRSSLIVTGGVELMSRAPYIMQGARWGLRYGSTEIIDMLHEGLTDTMCNMSMGLTAENLANIYKVPREEQDEWAARSQMRAEAAKNNGIFSEEIAPVKVRTKMGRETIADDETIRGASGTTKLKELPSAFQNDGTITAGNSSGLNDGASITLVSTEEWARNKGIKPLARIIGMGVTGVDPSIMGVGPIHAIPLALKMAGLELKDMDLIEINEAFAAQILVAIKELKLDTERLNVNGGAIALGHPLGASGNRILLHLAKELNRREARYGVAALCIGGGQGIAMVIERVV